MSNIQSTDLLLVERDDTSYKIEYQDLQLNSGGGGGGGNYVNVKDFGAKGNGLQTEDDAPAIQAAIDSMSDGGGTLYFPAGEYRLSSTLVINRVNDPEAPNTNRNRINIKGDGKGNTVLKFQQATQGAGQVCLHYIGVPTSPGTGAAHIYSTISDIAFSSTNKLAGGLRLEGCAYISVNEVTFHYCDNCMELESTLSSYFSGLVFNESNRGVLSNKGDGFSPGHANTFVGCQFRFCSTNAYDSSFGSTNVGFIGCQIEGCGTMGDPNSGGCLFRLNSRGGEVGPTFYNCYFEVNKGGYDIWAESTAVGDLVSVTNIYSCNFNRVSSNYYVTYNIISGGKAGLNLHGCTFTGYNDYVPSASRPYFLLSQETDLTEVGCQFDTKVEKPPIGQSLSFAGTVKMSGNTPVGRLPLGWTVQRLQEGVTRVIHNLNNVNYALVATSIDGNPKNIQRVACSVNGFDVVMVDFTNDAQDGDYAFTLQYV